MAENERSEKIYFCKPEKRFIIPINSFHTPKKLFSEFKKEKYQFTINSNFALVIKNCAKSRRKNKGTFRLF